MTGDLDPVPTEYQRMQAEIERLRVALQEIAALPPVDGLDPFEANRRGQEFRLNEQARSIARRALEPKP